MMKRLTVFLMTAVLSMTLIACSKQRTTQPSTEFSEIEAGESGNATSGKEFGKSDGNDHVHPENPTENSSFPTATAEATTAEKENVESEPTENTSPSKGTEITISSEATEETISTEGNGEIRAFDR